MRDAIALAKMLPIYPKSQNVAVSMFISLNTSTVNIRKLMKLTLKYLIHEVSIAREVRWEVSRAIRIRRAEQAFLTT